MFDNTNLPEYTPTKYVQSAQLLSDKELVKELLTRQLLVQPYCEKAVPLKMTMYSPEERHEIRRAMINEMSSMIGRKLAANEALVEEVWTDPAQGTHVKQLRLSAFVLPQQHVPRAD